MPENGSPYISVIITAHDRKEYLKGAIESVINQSLGRGFFEIVLVKNFEDPEINSLLLRKRIVTVDVADLDMGECLAAGIERSRGEIVSFLDDDDIFEEGKLDIVMRKFKEDASLGFYHNAHSIIDDSGNIMSMRYHPNPPSEIRISKKAPWVGNVFRFQRYDPHFNSSSISIRREILLDSLGYLRKLTINPDAFLYYIALKSDMDLLMDQNILTRYRMHAQNSKSNVRGPFRDFIKAYSQVQREFLSSYITIRDAVSKSPVESVLQCSIEENEILLMFVAGGSRRRMLRHCRNYWKCARMRGNTYGKMLLFLGVVYTVFPLLAMYIHYYRKPS